MRFCGLPHRPFPHTVSRLPYNHTPDAFPHTFWQIPIGRPFSHSHGRSPIARPSPHTIYNLFKTGFSFDETSGSSSTNPQPTTSSKHPEPALQSSKPIPNRFQQITHHSLQTKRRPSPANHTYLRLWGAVTSCMRTPVVRPWSHSCAHGHAASSWACARPRSHIHGHAHIVQRPWRKPILTRPAYGSHKSSANPVHSTCPAAA